MIYTTAQVALRLGVETWRVRRIYQLGLLPEPERMGIYRAVPESDIPMLRAELAARGWLPAVTRESEAETR